MKITICGAGVFGSSLASILQDNGHLIQFFDPLRFPAVSLSRAITHTQLILLACPSHTIPALLAQLPVDTHTLPLVCASKGLADPSLFTEFPQFSVIAGATFATDLQQRRPSVFTITDSRLADYFAADFLDFQITADLHGILLCGAAKNLFAFEAGRQQLSPDAPQFATFLNQASQELTTLLHTHSADPATVQLSCGIPDLRLTCSSVASRNYQFGQAFANYQLKHFFSHNPTVESFHTAHTYAHFLKHPDLPLLNSILTTIANTRLIFS